MNTDKTTAVERPILFSGPMVRAILEGRKTQTRRVVVPQPQTAQMISEGAASLCYPAMLHRACPYGRPGERLWVKETFQEIPDDGGTIVYRATDPDWESTEEWTWKPSIFMPRWASRVTLEIVGVRVERVTDISFKDCLAEGIQLAGRDSGDCRMAYMRLWDSLNAQRGFGWEKNPWVWVVEFKRLDV